VTGNKLAEEVIRAYLAETYVYNERSGKKVDRIVEYEKAH
jgi:ribose 5-phosphate isomerase RpiB